MKKLSMIMFMLSISIMLFAGNNSSESITSITGKVIDQKTKESLVGVQVKLKDTEQYSYTDFDGNFTFNNIKEGDYTIETNYISYEENAINNIYVSKEIVSTNLHIELETK